MFTRKKDTPEPVALTPLEQPRPTAPAPQLQPQPEVQAPPPPPPPQAQAQTPAPTPAPAPAPQPAPRPKPHSLLTPGLTIRGDVIGDVEVQLDCVVMGDVKVGKL